MAVTTSKQTDLSVLFDQGDVDGLSLVAVPLRGDKGSVSFNGIMTGSSHQA